MRNLLLILSFIVLQQSLSSAQSNPVAISIQDTLLINPGPNGQLLLPYRVLPKQTLYSISQFFNCSFDLLYQNNPSVKDKGLQIGETIVIPLQIRSLAAVLPLKSSNYYPIYYRIQEKETMYRISKVYFQVSEDHIMKLNNMKTNQVNNGQLILLGYLKANLIASEVPAKLEAKPIAVATPVASAPRKQKQDILVKDIPVSASTPVRDLLKEEEKTNPEDNVIEDEFKKPGVKYRNHADKGVAFWHKESRLTKGYFVLHPTAAINSVMDITNSSNGKTVRAKVVGNIPPNTYPKDILIIVSPQVAAELGALDSRFFAKLKYTAEVLPVNDFNN